MSTELENWQKMAERLNQDYSIARDSLGNLQARFDALQAELTAYKVQGVQAAQAVLAADDKGACDAIAHDILKNKKDRDIAAADKAAAEANAYAAALRAA